MPLALALALLSACGGTEAPVVAPPQPPVAGEHQISALERPPPGVMRGAFFMADGAPEPSACTTDADCAADTVTDAAGCCVVQSTPIAQSQRYHEWLSARRAGPDCAAAACVIFPPSQPLDCEIHVHCATGQCANACGGPPPASVPES